MGIEAMRDVMKLTQTRNETTKGLGARATKLSTIAYPGEVSENAAIQVQLADLLVDALKNECIRHDMIKEAPIGLSVAIDLCKERIWEKMRNTGERVQGHEETGGRKNRGKETTTWNKGVGLEKDQLKKWEEVPNRGE